MEPRLYDLIIPTPVKHFLKSEQMQPIYSKLEQTGVRIYSYSQLNFGAKIGEGGFGEVYEGFIDN